MSTWFTTDPDTNQRARKVGPRKWKISEDGEVRTFDIGALSDQEIWEEVKYFYPSLQALKENAGWPLIVAECMSENRAELNQ
jgi:hypothetical protein